MKLHQPPAIKDNYLLIMLSGKYKMDDSFPKLNKIKKDCEEKKINKVMIDLLQVDFTGIPMMDRFFIGEAVSKIFGPKIKAAFVVKNVFITRFMETVAVNRGANVAIFSEVESAEKWLNKR